MRAMVVAEKPRNHYPHTTNKSPYISNRDTTKKFWVFLQQWLLLDGCSYEKCFSVVGFVQTAQTMCASFYRSLIGNMSPSRHGYILL